LEQSFSPYVSKAPIAGEFMVDYQNAPYWPALTGVCFTTWKLFAFVVKIRADMEHLGVITL
jgi:hypothetical protein